MEFPATIVALLIGNASSKAPSHSPCDVKSCALPQSGYVNGCAPLHSGYASRRQLEEMYGFSVYSVPKIPNITSDCSNKDYDLSLNKIPNVPHFFQSAFPVAVEDTTCPLLGFDIRYGETILFLEGKRNLPIFIEASSRSEQY